MFALDRMIKVDDLSEEFTMPKDFNAEDYLEGIYGVRIYPDMKKEMVRLKVYGMQVQYFRSLPLHASQKEIETRDDYSVFSYYFTTDYDFKQDILSFGDKVEVLEPMSLREEIKGVINEMLNKYK